MSNEFGPQANESGSKTGIEDLEQYLLRSRRAVLPLLNAMKKKPDLITARIPSSDLSVMTAVLEVLPKKNLVILDYGSNEKLNKKLLAEERIVFTTRHDMVETRFSCDNVKRVKYKGEPAFAALIPASIMHLQRREYFRIKPLIQHPVYVSLLREDQYPLKLKAIDICIKGLSLEDSGSVLKVSEHDHIENCKLTLPANPSLTVNLEVRYTTNILSKEGQAANRIGGRFTNFNQSDEFTLQRFINMVQIEKNAISKG